MGRHDASGYRWADAAPTEAHAFLLPVLRSELDHLWTGLPPGERRLFELGCGNGSMARVLATQGWDVMGVDPAEEGIAQANRHEPRLKLYVGSAYDDLASKYGRFPVVTSLEVVEHVYAPRTYAATLFDLLLPGGTAIVSTPFHGYWKNLALAVTGKMDRHFTALWDHGHIKFWSMNTLGELLGEAGFVDISFKRVGRIRALARSMIAIARKPGGSARHL